MGRIWPVGSRIGSVAGSLNAVRDGVAGRACARVGACALGLLPRLDALLEQVARTQAERHGLLVQGERVVKRKVVVAHGIDDLVKPGLHRLEAVVPLKRHG